MAQCIRVLATKPDDLSVILGIHMVQAEPLLPLVLWPHACCGTLARMQAYRDK